MIDGMIQNPEDRQFIERFIKERAEWRGNTEQFAVADTIELLEYLEKRGIHIYGIEGLQLVGKGIRPDQGLEFDFEKVTIQDTIQAIKHLDDSHRFEFLFLVDFFWTKANRGIR